MSLLFTKYTTRVRHLPNMGTIEGGGFISEETKFGFVTSLVPKFSPPPVFGMLEQRFLRSSH